MAEPDSVAGLSGRTPGGTGGHRRGHGNCSSRQRALTRACRWRRATLDACARCASSCVRAPIACDFVHDMESKAGFPRPGCAALVVSARARCPSPRLSARADSPAAHAYPYISAARTCHARCHGAVMSVAAEDAAAENGALQHVHAEPPTAVLADMPIPIVDMDVWADSEQ
jgi:hypothetical protein